MIRNEPRVVPPLALLLLGALIAPALLAQSSSSDIVLRPGRLASVHGGWSIVSDASAAEGVAVRHPNAGGAKLSSALAQPTHYFDVTFQAGAQVPYRLWLRAKAQSNYFSASGRQRLRIQTREDGLAIDQIAISPAQFLSASPGSTKNDTTILTRP